MENNDNKNNVRVVDSGIISKYFILLVIFSLVIYGINYVVLNACSISPTGRVGNGILTLYEVHNTGAAFNLFAGQPGGIIAASFIALIIMIGAVMMFSSKINSSLASSLSLLSSGIFMNMVDRLLHGYVIDYISCDFAPGLPIFNTADILIVFGALGIIIALFSKN